MAGYDSNYQYGRNYAMFNGNGPEDIWPGPLGTIPIATINEGIYVASTDTSDVGIIKIFSPLKSFEKGVGEGARVLNDRRFDFNREYWIDQSIVPVILNGTNPTFCGSFISLDRARFREPNVGTITFQRGSDFTSGVPDNLDFIRSHIVPGKKETEQAMWTIPDSLDFTHYWIKEWKIGMKQTSQSGNQPTEGIFDLLIWDVAEDGWRVADSQPLERRGNTNSPIEFAVPFPDVDGLPGQSRVKIQAEVTGGDVESTGRFSLSNVLEYK